MIVLKPIYMIASALVALHAAASWGQDFPSKPVRIIVANPAGSGSDIVTRIVVPEFSKALGQPVIVEPKPGNDQLIGAVYVAKQVPADGYTVGVYTLGNLASVPALVKDPRFAPLKDLPPFSTMVAGRSYLGTPPNAPWKNFDEMVVYAKANPGKLNYAATSVSQRLRMEPVLMKFGLNIVSVPYPTTGAAETAILGGQVQFIFANASQVSKKGGMWALATTGNRRHPKFPDVPTFIELGLPPVPGAEYSMHAPAGTPRPAINRLHAALSKALQNADVVERMDKLAYEVVNDTPEEAIKYLDTQIRLANDVAKKIGLEPQ
jgi:tripartite-type tricarboxylate transporter receptor subunit TctC